MVSFFVSDQIGWAVGDLSILKTADGGETWINQIEGTGQNFYPESVRFLGMNVGLIGLRIWKNIEKQRTVVKHGLSPMINQGPGFIPACLLRPNSVGWWEGNGILMKTTDGGDHWEKQEMITYNKLGGVYFFNEMHGWVCGDGGTLFKNNKWNNNLLLTKNIYSHG
jgi:photosystem II stability/assembly factor-like uncharacterized protein